MRKDKLQKKGIQNSEGTALFEIPVYQDIKQG